MKTFELLLDGLRKVNNIIPGYGQLIKASMCKDEDATILCSLGKCPRCCDAADVINQEVVQFLQTQQLFTIFQWDSESKKKPVVMSMDRIEMELVNQLTTIRTHSFIAKCQIHQMKFLKSSLESSSGTAILQARRLC